MGKRGCMVRFCGSAPGLQVTAGCMGSVPLHCSGRQGGNARDTFWRDIWREKARGNLHACIGGEQAETVVALWRGLQVELITWHLKANEACSLIHQAAPERALLGLLVWDSPRRRSWGRNAGSRMARDLVRRHEPEAHLESVAHGQRPISVEKFAQTLPLVRGYGASLP